MFEPLGSQIRVRRQQLGLTIDALAVGARVSRSRLIALEKGNDNVTLDLLVRIANALGITEFHIGGLRVVAATPDFRTAMTTAEAMQDAMRVLDEAVRAREEFKRAMEPVAGMLPSVFPPETAGPEDEREPAAEGEQGS